MFAMLKLMFATADLFPLLSGGEAAAAVFSGVMMISAFVGTISRLLGMTLSLYAKSPNAGHRKKGGCLKVCSGGSWRTAVDD